MTHPPIVTWPAEIMALAQRYAGRDFAEPRAVVVEVLRAYSDEEWTIPEFKAVLDSIPSEYAESARVVFERGWYDESDRFLVQYQRAETEDEVSHRIGECYRYAVNQANSERREYERLRAKFSVPD